MELRLLGPAIVATGLGLAALRMLMCCLASVRCSAPTCCWGGGGGGARAGPRRPPARVLVTSSDSQRLLLQQDCSYTDIENLRFCDRH